MQTQVNGITPQIDAELDKLAALVDARKALRAARENYTAYAAMSGSRLNHLKAVITEAEANVNELAGVAS